MGLHTRDLHALAEARSLALHARVAELLREDPTRLAAARGRVADWRAHGQAHQDYIDAWGALIDGPFTALLAFLTDRGARARALRQVTPFVDFVPPRERWKLWRETRDAFERHHDTRPT